MTIVLFVFLVASFLVLGCLLIMCLGIFEVFDLLECVHLCVFGFCPIVLSLPVSVTLTIYLVHFHELFDNNGFNLNCVCVCVCAGQSGLGKSTLMNTLFKSKVSRKSVMGTAEERIPKTIEIKSISHGKATSCFCPKTVLTHILHTHDSTVIEV